MKTLSIPESPSAPSGRQTPPQQLPAAGMATSIPLATVSLIAGLASTELSFMGMKDSSPPQPARPAPQVAQSALVAQQTSALPVPGENTYLNQAHLCLTGLVYQKVQGHSQRPSLLTTTITGGQMGSRRSQELQTTRLTCSQMPSPGLTSSVPLTLVP